MRCAAIMITLALFAAGCGSSERSTSSEDPPAECERMTAEQFIGDIPRDYEVAAPADPEPIDAFVGRLRKEVGEAYRDHDASILGLRSQVSGTVVVLVNTDEPSAEDVVAGAKSAEKDSGIQGERLDIAGNEGRLQRATDGSYVAMAPAGECSVAILVDTNKTRLKDAASVIRPRG